MISTNEELYSLDTLSPRSALPGKYVNGEVYFTSNGKIYVFTHQETGKRFRISRKGLGYLSAYGDRYYDIPGFINDEPTLRVRKSFEIKSIVGNVIELVKDIWSNRLPF